MGIAPGADSGFVPRENLQVPFFGKGFFVILPASGRKKDEEILKIRIAVKKYGKVSQAKQCLPCFSGYFCPVYFRLYMI